MFDTIIDKFDVIFGIILACFILYMFWLWIEAGYIQWDAWNSQIKMSNIQKEEKENRLWWMKTPPRVLADTYQPILFWSTYYAALYDIPFNPFGGSKK